MERVQIGMTSVARAIQCVVFDFDGTLVQSNEIKREAYFEAAADFGISGDLVAAALKTVSGDRFAVFHEVALRARESDKTDPETTTLIRRLVDRYTMLCEERISVCPEVPGARAALQELRQSGYALFLNSATPAEALRRIVELRDLTGSFLGVFGGPTGKTGNLLEIFSIGGFKPDAVVFVGDGEDDRRAAVEAGCGFVGLAPATPRFDSSGVRVVSDLTGIVGVIEEFEGSDVTLTGGRR